METTNRLTQYLALLQIRQKAYRRDVILFGVFWLAAILVTTALLLFTAWDARSIWLMGVFDVFFTVSFIMAWARFTMNKQTIELLNNLQA